MYIHYEEEKALEKVIRTLKEKIPTKQELVIVCIGTDVITADCLAPLVGYDLTEKLKHESMEGVHVYGTIHKPIHGQNLGETIRTIHHLHPDAFVIGIDSCLGKMENIGKILIQDCPVYPGAGIHKLLPPVGKISIQGIISEQQGSINLTSRHIRLSLVYHLKDLIVKGLWKVLYERRIQKRD